MSRPRPGSPTRRGGRRPRLFDYDLDGRLDIFIVNYVAYDPTWPCRAPSGEPRLLRPRLFGVASRLFRNRGGEKLAFEDVSERTGIPRSRAPGLGVAVADFDGDGRPDIFVANDGEPNHLWMNQKDGTFREERFARGVARTESGHAYAGMGVAMGDVDNDGLLDLFVTHLTSETNTLWQQVERRLFRDRTEGVDWRR